MEYISKTQKKKEAESLQKLGERLISLSPEQLKDIDLPEEIRDAVSFAKTVRSRRALRRQMQYIGMLMRNIDPEPVRDVLQHIDQGRSVKAAIFKETEKWRDGLVAGNTMVMEDILKKCPEADSQQIARLVRNAKSHKASRALFRYLMNLRSETD